PNQVLPDDVGRGPYRDPAAHQTTQREAGAQLFEPEEEDRGDLARTRLEREALGDQADERMDLVPGDEGADRRQRADHLDVAGIEPDLLLGLAQSGRDQVLLRVVLTAAGH